MTLEPTLGSGDDPGHSILDYLTAYLSQDALHAAPHVHLGRNHSTGIKLRLEEACPGWVRPATQFHLTRQPP
jgi:hypothetical protein